MQNQSGNQAKFIQDIYTHLSNAKNELESVLNFCNDLYSKNVTLTNDEIHLIKYSLEERIDQGIRADSHLATDKIDLSPLFKLREKFNQLDDSQVNDNEILF